MPSPIGHALAGVAVAWSADSTDRPRPSFGALTIACAALAAAPDLDLLLPGAHRTFTHSFAATAVVFILAAAVTGQVTRWRTAAVCAAAYGSHLLLDWLGTDARPPRGIQLFWPFSVRWCISDLDLFRETVRQHFLTAPVMRANAIAVAQELAILLPLLAVVWLIRVKAAARFASELPRRDHAPQ